MNDLEDEPYFFENLYVPPKFGMNKVSADFAQKYTKKCRSPEVVRLRTNSADLYCKRHILFIRALQESNLAFLERSLSLLHMLRTEFCLIRSSYDPKVVL